MGTVLVMLGSIGLIVGSLTAGILICWLLWSAFKLIRHPELGPPLVVIPAFLALTGRLPDSEFLAMTLIFAVLAVVPFCIEGLAWRARTLDRDVSLMQAVAPAIDRLSTPAISYGRYPAIAGCICEARRPSPGELKRVASRVLHEAFAGQGPAPAFAEKRAALRAAKAALEGADLLGAHQH
jgi:hypothetical protein